MSRNSLGRSVASAELDHFPAGAVVHDDDFPTPSGNGIPATASIPLSGVLKWIDCEGEQAFADCQKLTTCPPPPGEEAVGTVVGGFLQVLRFFQ